MSTTKLVILLSAMAFGLSTAHAAPFGSLVGKPGVSAGAPVELVQKKNTKKKTSKKKSTKKKK